MNGTGILGPGEKSNLYYINHHLKRCLPVVGGQGIKELVSIHMGLLTLMWTTPTHATDLVKNIGSVGKGPSEKEGFDSVFRRVLASPNHQF